MHAPLVVFVSFFLAGCAGGGALPGGEDTAEAPGGEDTAEGSGGLCEQDLLFPAGLSYFLLRGAGIDPREAPGPVDWDLDPGPQGEGLARVRGSWDPATGAFWWRLSYREDSPLLWTEARGTADFDEAGNEASSWEESSLDVLGVERRWSVEQERRGCVLERRREDPEGLRLEERGRFGGGSYAYVLDELPGHWTSQAFPWPAEGVRLADGSRLERWSVPVPEDPEQGSWWAYRQALLVGPAGDYELAYRHWNAESAWRREGRVTGWPDGSRQEEIDWHSEDWGGHVSLWLDYAGDGEGTFTADFYDAGSGEWREQDCAVLVEGGACSVTCPDGSEPSCRFFLME